MAQLTEEQVRHIAKLARLELSDDEAKAFAPELTSILKYIDMLTEVQTKDVPPTAQSIDLVNAVREDEVYKEELASPDDLLNQSPLGLLEHQIKSPSAHG